MFATVVTFSAPDCAPSMITLLDPTCFFLPLLLHFTLHSFALISGHPHGARKQVLVLALFSGVLFELCVIRFDWI